MIHLFFVYTRDCNGTTKGLVCNEIEHRNPAECLSKERTGDTSN